LLLVSLNQARLEPIVCGHVV